MLRNLSKLSRASIAAVSKQLHAYPPVTLGIRFLTTIEYHNIADSTLDTITEGFESLIEVKPDVDVDLAQGVLTIQMPPAGTYVINKQPPFSQIWLSSPISGPKHYDWNEKQKAWISTRDPDITLGELLRRETKDCLGLDLNLEVD